MLFPPLLFDLINQRFRMSPYENFRMGTFIGDVTAKTVYCFCEPQAATRNQGPMRPS